MKGETGMTDFSQEMIELGKNAKEASRLLARLTTADKNDALFQMAAALELNMEKIIQANKKDIEIARENGLTEPLIERLTLNEARIQGMVSGIKQVASLPDPLTVTG